MAMWETMCSGGQSIEEGVDVDVVVVVDGWRVKGMRHSGQCWGRWRIVQRIEWSKAAEGIRRERLSVQR